MYYVLVTTNASIIKSCEWGEEIWFSDTTEKGICNTTVKEVEIWKEQE